MLLVLYDFVRCVPDEAAEGPREVCLIEIANATNHIENRNSFSKQVRHISRALDLSKSSVGNASRPQEVPLHRAQGKLGRPTLQCILYDGIPRKDARLDESLDERV